jgi:glycine cleavage system aminomethyltransferase T
MTKTKNLQPNKIHKNNIYKQGNHISMVVNAGCADKDIAHFKSQLSSFGKGVELEVVNDESLLALQGTKFLLFLLFN